MFEIERDIWNLEIFKKKEFTAINHEIHNSNRHTVLNESLFNKVFNISLAQKGFKKALWEKKSKLTRVEYD